MIVIARRAPAFRLGFKIRSASHHDVLSCTNLKTIKFHHAEERDSQLFLEVRMSPKFLNRFGDKKRRSDVEAASFRQWEEPLYVVVHGSHQLIGPPLMAGRKSTPMS